MTISIHLNNLQMINDLYSHSQSIGVEMETLLLNLTNQMADLMQDSHDFDVNLVSKLTFDFSLNFCGQLLIYFKDPG